MNARSLGADLVDIALAAAIASFPAHLFAVGGSTAPLPGNGFVSATLDGPFPGYRILVFVVVTAAVFAVLRFGFDREGQGPGRCLLSLRRVDGRVVEDEERLDLLERLGAVGGRFGRRLILALSCIVALMLWGAGIERTAIQAHHQQLLRAAYIYDAEFDCCAGSAVGTHACPRLLEVVAAIADRTDGTGDVPPRQMVLDRCPAARSFTRR